MEENKPLYEVAYDFENDSPWIGGERPWQKLCPKSVPKTVRYPELPLHMIGREAARNYPQNLAIYFVNEERKYTYRELMYWSDRIAVGLAEMGVRKGDGVGVYMTNSPEFIFTVYGITQTGATVVPINPMLKPHDIQHIITDSGIIRTVICSAPLYPNLKPLETVAGIENVVIDGEAEEGTISLRDLMEETSGSVPSVDIDPKKDLCVLLYTGGTTGAPKGVMLTHYNITTNVYQMIGMEPTSEKEEGKTSCMTVLPMCHAFGFSQVQLYIAQKAMMILNNGFEPDKIMGLIQRYRTENFVGIPLMYQLLINDPAFSQFDLSSLNRVISGAAPLPQELTKKWTDTVGSEVGQGYGLSEASPSTHMKPVWLENIGDSIGIPILDTDVKIVATENRSEQLPAGDIGELAIKGPQVMQGYWKKPEATSAAIQDGWLYTGDLAYMDEKGRFFIAGRANDMIKYKGYKVLPDEVEDYLYQHPAILECAVVGVPDPEIGETIKAYVVLRDEFKGQVTEAEIKEWAKKEMAGYKWPRQVAFIDAVPRTAIGKVDRKPLRDPVEGGET
jgi:long-chain acyl-CoA synthetase